MELNARIDTKLLAIAEDTDCGMGRVDLSEIRFSDEYYGPFRTNRYFMVTEITEEIGPGSGSYDMIFNDLRSAVIVFGKKANAKYIRHDGSKERVYGKVQWTEHWKYVMDEIIPRDYDEHEEKDYGPSNPWDAPGMKISDFLPGVY